MAAPLFNYRLLGHNLTQDPGHGFPFSATVTSFNVGDTIEYQLVGNVSPIGTIYAGNTGAAAITITSLTTGPDGVNTLRADLFQLSTDSVQVDLSVGTLAAGWANTVDQSPGQLANRGNGNDDITGIRPGATAGVFKALNPEIILTGTMMVSSIALSSASEGGIEPSDIGSGGAVVRVRWSSGAGSIHVNGTGLARFPTLGGTESPSATAPLVSYTPLTIVPEPGGLLVAAVGLLSAGAWRRRRT
jgi:hypothetical protein